MRLPLMGLAVAVATAAAPDASAPPEGVTVSASFAQAVARDFGIHLSQVDPATNSVVVVAQPGAGAGVKQFAAGGIDPATVTVESAAPSAWRA